MTTTIIFLSPIIVSIGALIFALKKSYNKTALIISAAFTMAIEMLTMKYFDSWYALLLSLTIPFAFLYILICTIDYVKNNKAE